MKKPKKNQRPLLLAKDKTNFASNVQVEIEYSSTSNVLLGVYDVVPKSCYKFEQDVYKYDTSSPKVLELTATHYMVKGQIEATKEKSKVDISVNIAKQGVETESIYIL